MRFSCTFLLMITVIAIGLLMTSASAQETLAEQRADVTLKIAKKLEARGEFDKAADAYLQSYRLDAERLTHWHMDSFQKSNRLVELAEFLTEDRLRNSETEQVVHLFTYLMQDKVTHPAGLVYLRRLWKIRTQHRNYVMEVIPRSVWKDVPTPILIDLVKPILIPTDDAAEGDGWDRITGGKDSLYYIDALRQNSSMLQQLERDISGQVNAHPEWKAGVAVLCYLEAKLGNNKRSVELLRQLLEDAKDQPIPIKSAWSLAVGLRGQHEPLDLLVIRLLENCLPPGPVEGDPRTLPIVDLAKLYAKFNREKEAVELLYRMAPDKDVAAPLMADEVNSTNHGATALIEIGFPVDAMILTKPFVQRHHKHKEGWDQLWVNSGVNHLLKTENKAKAAIKPQDVSKALQRGLFVGNRNENQKATTNSVIDLGLHLRGQRETRPKICSTLMSVLAASVQQQKPVDAADTLAAAELDRRLMELFGQHPRDLSAGIAATTFAFLRNDLIAAEHRLDKLSAVIDPAEPSAGDVAIWLVARQAIAHEQTRIAGQKLADHALAAAKRQSDENWKTAIESEREQYRNR